MKKIFLTTIISMFLFISTSFANGIDISNANWQYDKNYGEVIVNMNYMELNKINYMYADLNYPKVGVTDYGCIYLDKSSCNYYIQDNIAYLSCIAYFGSGGSDGNGNFAKLTPFTYRFCTYKEGNNRKIILLSVVNSNSGVNVTKNELVYDNGFLKGLFWKVANQINLSKDLD